MYIPYINAIMVSVTCIRMHKRNPKSLILIYAQRALTNPLTQQTAFPNSLNNHSFLSPRPPQQS